MNAQQLIDEVTEEQKKKYDLDTQICELIKKANPSLIKYLSKLKQEVK